MKRRRRYGEKYAGLPYPEEFKKKMLELFPGDGMKEALDGGWDSVGRWFDELCGHPTFSVSRILGCLKRGEEGVDELHSLCVRKIERRKRLEALSDEWQRIVFLDDQSCRPWKEKAEC